MLPVLTMGGEVLHHVVRHAGAGLQHMLRDGKGAGREQQRVAIGRRLRDPGVADHPARAGPVVDQHRLAGALRKLLGIGARDGVGVAAGRIGDDDGDRLRRPGLRHGRSSGA